jgi:hypothetical protein
MATNLQKSFIVEKSVPRNQPTQLLHRAANRKHLARRPFVSGDEVELPILGDMV